MNHNKVIRDRNETKFNEHGYQRYLEEQLDWITVEHDDLRKELNEQLSTPKYHPSMSIIDQWEKEMIENIRRMAVFARRTLISALDQNVYQVKKNMNKITPVLRDARAGIRPFTERDLKEWITLLKQWRKMPPLSIQIEKRNSIQELTIDLDDHHRKPSDVKHIDSFGLISIIRSAQSNNPDQQHISISNRTETDTSGGVIIICE